ncbi:hypothetical protein NL108_004103 [Boleophthalmus pectinirostris]|nr:hypothetical protein NL108_004103 [Boleophthalmus pectinirostris]
MPRSRNKIEDSSVKKREKKRKLKKFYPFVSGNTKDSHKRILQKLKKKGAKEMDSIDKSQVVLIFCPIVSRFDSDISAALDEVKKKEAAKLPKLILVAMHHTHNPEYVVPPKTEYSQDNGEESVPVVHFLFHETKGLLRCLCNKKAIKTLQERMGFKSKSGKCAVQ